jgi:hypothetical protein
VRAVLVFSCVAVASALITACSNRCETMCGMVNSCSLTQRATDIDCPEYCKDVPEMNARMVSKGFPGCAAEFDEHLSCWEQNKGSVCDSSFTGCRDAGFAWRDCMRVYCRAVSTDGGDRNCVADGGALLPPF